ncbi:MAG: DNA-binding transcription factor yap1 [Thelocarpon impressellum]|nr:MAG: DNA-binding transcription factor yap1 [Thelocarpon impressellum]
MTSTTQRAPGSEPPLDTSALFESPLQNETPDSGYYNNGSGVDESPFLDYSLDLDLDGSFDIDDSALVEGQMIGNLPGPSSSTEGDVDSNDKRKSPGDDGTNADGGRKRREGDEKSAKKPGRKPLTSEPTSKRKAQNRAAQRAFRDRKEKHLKDLEVKVADLEKASESANHENGILRAQVDRMSNELKDYRKRLSGSNGVGRSPTSNATAPSYLPSGISNPFGSPNDFNFDFPRFGAGLARPQATSNGMLPKSTLPQGSTAPGKVPASVTRSVSQPEATSRDGNVNVQQHSMSVTGKPSSAVESLSGLFSPSILETVSKSSSADFPFLATTASPVPLRHGSASSNVSTGANSHPPGLQQYGGSNHSDTTSPSASSVSQKGAGSSCGTSPEPSSYSPATGKLTEPSLNTINEENDFRGGTVGGTTFWDSPNHAGTLDQTSGGLPLQSGDNFATLAKTPASEINGIDWLAQQNGGQFDPVLFGDYREPQDAITSGEYDTFFNEAFPLPDLNSPFNGNLATNPEPRKDILQEMESRQNEEGKQPEQPSGKSRLLTQQEIWDRMQCLQKMRDKEDFDIDDLCADMKKKAKCTETGLMLDQKDVDAMLEKLSKQAEMAPHG